jgi:hypothetical protein
MKQKSIDAQILDLFMDCLVWGAGIATVFALSITVYEAILLRELGR